MVPDFIVIGAGRSGTTSLHHYLTQHPQIAMSRRKETNFFAALAGLENLNNEMGSGEIYPVRSTAEYAEQFTHAQPDQICGDASPRYIYASGVPEQIALYAPKVRLVAILRDPVERAWSNWMGRRNAGWEKRSFEQTVDAETSLLNQPFYPGEPAILRIGLYHQHLSRYLNIFPREQMLILLFDDFKKSPTDVMTSVFRFLGVDPSVQIDTSVRFNPTGEAKSKLVDRMTAKSPLTTALKNRLPQPIARPLYRVAMRLRSSNRSRPEMSADVRQKLQSIYKTDIAKLEQLLDRDLSDWHSLQEV